MKLLLDANLSPEVARLLKDAGHDAIHVADIGLLTATDPEILQAAAKEERVLLTADSDFGALLALGSLALPSAICPAIAFRRPSAPERAGGADGGQLAADRRRPGEGSNREPHERSPARS